MHVSSTPRSGCPMVGRAMVKEIAKKLRDFWSNVFTDKTNMKIFHNNALCHSNSA